MFYWSAIALAIALQSYVHSQVGSQNPHSDSSDSFYHNSRQVIMRLPRKAEYLNQNLF